MNMIKKQSLWLVVAVLFMVTLSGCNTLPKDAFQLTETALQDRQLQTRKYQTADEIALLSAGVAVLQDMGYTLESTEKEVGLLTASKTADARNGAEIAGKVILALLGGGMQAVDKEQKIRVTFVTRPSATEKGHVIARITFQRIVWNTRGQVTKAESIRSTELYEGFFDKLSKSVFLEGARI